VIRIELTEEQAAALRETLASYVGDLRMEIASTDSMDFRERLKRTEKLLKEVMATLDAPPL
jgi:hypothetical protein